jgi:hypothetical protein
MAFSDYFAEMSPSSSPCNSSAVYSNSSGVSASSGGAQRLLVESAVPAAWGDDSLVTRKQTMAK